MVILTCLHCWSTPGWARPVEMSCYQAGQVVSQVQVAVAPEFRPESSRFSKAITQIGQGRCQVSLRYLINSRFDDLIDQELPYDGMNCWSSAMLFKGLRKTAIYMHEPEVKWIFDESKACRKLGAQEKPQTGDIGAIRQFTNSDKTKIEELHAFIFLNPELAISKQSYSFEAQIELTHPDQFFNQFGGKEAGVECETSKTCEAFTTYYRCDSKQFQNPDLNQEPFLFANIQSLAEKLEVDLRKGTDLSKIPVKDEAYLAEIAVLNDSIFSPTPPIIPYGLKLFESAVWQYTALQAGARTPMKGKE